MFEVFFPDLDPNASSWDLSKAFGLGAQAMINNKYLYAPRNSKCRKWILLLKKYLQHLYHFYKYIQINYKDREILDTL
ncbi:MAG: hypothetical protein IPL25_19080 [Saprospiraceae bacterium]|nr:hypothetical protein [Candidatus Vicinibacter affinis]